jgi:hypothetical protein
MALDTGGFGGSSSGAGVLFIVSATNAMDVFSATNSSPWTAENFGGNQEKVDSLREYVYHAIVLTSITNITGAVLERSWAPVLGAALASGYMWWLYERAVARGMDAGSDGWESEKKDG